MADTEARGDQFPALVWKALASDSLVLHFEPRDILEIITGSNCSKVEHQLGVRIATTIL